MLGNDVHCDLAKIQIRTDADRRGDAGALQNIADHPHGKLPCRHLIGFQIVRDINEALINAVYMDVLRRHMLQVYPIDMCRVVHVYSIDECFIDVTDYLKLYDLTPKEMALRLIHAVMEETGITATAGVGTNLYLAKIAMDIVAKHVDDHIGMLDEMSYRKLLWGHRPLSDFWRIGHRTERRLAGYGIHTMGDIARMSLTSEDWLFRQFGIDAELLIDHAWGYESCSMKDIHNYHSETHCLSNGQVLMRNYAYEEAQVVVKEMTDVLVLDLVEKKLITDSVTLYISYDHRFGHPGSGGTVNLGYATNSSEQIIRAVEELYLKITDPYIGIRRINITANRVVAEGYHQWNIFEDPVHREKEKNLQAAILQVKRRYGKSAILRGVNLLECATMRERNRQIGGHWA